MAGASPPSRRLFTVGFTRKSAAQFFGRLREAGVRRLLDVRLNTTSQLSGFAKRDDLAFFLGELCGAAYRHCDDLAPTAPMLADYRHRRIDWDTYAQRFCVLMRERRIEQRWSDDELDGACLLCSEHLPHRCHRRLVAEYLLSRRPGWSIVHLT